LKQASTVRQISASRKQRESQASRFQRIYKAIRERICLLEYAPGTVLNEGQLADEFEVSRTPIRNVLQRLNYEGLLKTRNGGYLCVADESCRIDGRTVTGNTDAGSDRSR
jgi:DNA-binding GntR family transcriptional regulator